MGLKDVLTRERSLFRRRAPDPEAVRRLVESASFVLSDVVLVRDAVSDGRSVILRGVAVHPDDTWKDAAVERIARLGYDAYVRGDANELGIYVPLRRAREKGDRPWVNVALFVVTVLSTLFAWVYFFTPLDPFDDPLVLLQGVPFSATLLGILLVHEFGHYFAARRHDVRVSLPYFIPLPVGFGTMGAVIKSRSAIPDRAALVDIGASGPIAGFVVALVAIVYGTAAGHLGPTVDGGLVFGDSLLTRLVQHFVFGPVSGDVSLYVGPVFIAGWVGLFVTALNLMPASQLDGGHVARAVLGGKSRYVAHAVRFGLFAMGLLWTGWLVLAIVITLFGVVHPPVADEATPLSRSRKAIALITLVILLLTFMPIPFPM